jgi:hypothetical protein
MIYGGYRSLSPRPRPLPRKTSALDTYYRNGIPAGTLHGLGLAFSDLPNGGHNLRLYTYDPVGSQFGPPTAAACPGQWIYNTGHYDISLGTPCSNPDSQGFCDWQSMSNYAAAHGETLVMVSRGDLSILCGYRAPVSVQPAPLPTGTPSPTGPPSQSSYCIAYDQYGGQHATACPVGTPPGTVIGPRPTTPTSTGTRTTTTSTTTTTATGGGGIPGGGGGGMPGPAPDNTLLYLGIAVLVSVMLAK